MVEKLRVKQEKEIELLDAGIAQAKASGVDEQTMTKLENLRAQMKAESTKSDGPAASRRPPPEPHIRRAASGPGPPPAR